MARTSSCSAELTISSRRIVDAEIDYFDASIAQGAGDDLDAAIVAVETNFGHQNAELLAALGRATVYTRVGQLVHCQLSVGIMGQWTTDSDGSILPLLQFANFFRSLFTDSPPHGNRHTLGVTRRRSRPTVASPRTAAMTAGMSIAICLSNAGNPAQCRRYFFYATAFLSLAKFLHLFFLDLRL